MPSKPKLLIGKDIIVKLRGSMNKDRKLSDGLAMGCFAVACLVFLAYWGTWRANRKDDLSTQKPAAVFQSIYKIPLPGSVRYIKVVGEDHKMAGGMAMLIRVDNVDAFIKDLKHTPIKLEGPIFSEPNLLYNSDKEKKLFETAGGIQAIHKPEIYTFSQIHYSGWGGSVIIDRERRYVFADGGIF